MDCGGGSTLYFKSLSYPYLCFFEIPILVTYYYYYLVFNYVFLNGLQAHMKIN